MSNTDNFPSPFFTKTKFYVVYFIISCVFYVGLIILSVVISKTNKITNNNSSDKIIRKLLTSPEKVLKDLENLDKIDPFLTELNNKIFIGHWENKIHLNTKKKIYSNQQSSSIFTQTGGQVFIKLYYSNLEGFNQFSVIYSILDGNYKDIWIKVKVNYSLFQQSRFSKLNITLPEESPNIFPRYNIKSSKPTKATVLKNDIFRITNSSKILIDELELAPSMDKTNLMGNLTIASLGIDITIKSILLSYFDTIAFEKKIDNFSLLSISIALFNLYFTLLLIKESVTELVNPKTLSLSFLILNMLWDASLSFFWLFCGIVLKLNGFIFVSLIYFLTSSILEVKLVYFACIEQNREGILNQFHEKYIIIVFYLTFYSFLGIIIFIFFYFKVYNATLFIFMTLTFIPQIIHLRNCSSSANSLPVKNILAISLNKLFLPLYLRGINGNIFYAQPNTTFCISSIIIMTFEILILLLQKRFGGKFFIPKRCRNDYYNYFKTFKEIELANMNNSLENQICSICLSELKEKSTKASEVAIDNTLNNSKRNDDFEKIRKIPLRKIKRKIWNTILDIWKRNPQADIVMMTPCNHYFHPKCLQEWYKQKNECPICRLSLPSIE